MDAEFQNDGPIRTVDTLDTCAHVGAHAVLCGFRATLSTRRASLVGLEYLRPSDPGVDPQFHFSGKYQFHRDYRDPSVFMGWPIGLSSRGGFEPVGSA